MASTKKRDQKPDGGANQAQPKRPSEQPEAPRESDIVDEAGKDSFPASDPPPWTP